jgi:hypothetical protein
MTPTAILAATFTIAFEGLMMFQGKEDGGKFVAIVNACDHSPRIEVYHANKPVDTYTLRSGSKVSFLNATDGPITTTKSYDDHVPRLREYVLAGDIDDDVVKENFHDGVVAYVNLPAGKLTTYRGFTQQVRLMKRIVLYMHKNFCFARFVVLPDIPIHPAGVKLRIDGPGANVEYAITEGDIVIISNISAKKASHFHHYATLLSHDGELGSAALLAANTCTDVHESSLPISVTKVLDDLYPRTPNGDCGPTGNP